MSELTLFNITCGIVLFGILAVLISLLGPIIGQYAFGALPYILILCTAAAAGFLYILSRLKLEDAAEIIVAMGTIWLIVMLVLIFVSQFCLNIRPIELFEDAASVKIRALEDQVCEVVRKIEEYVKSKYGQQGIDSPALITNSMYIAGDNCQQGVGSIDERVQRMEKALGILLEQPLHQAIVALDCDKPDVQAPRILKWRLERIEKQIASYKNIYLNPLAAAQDKLKKGVISQKCKDLAINQ